MLTIFNNKFVTKSLMKNTVYVTEGSTSILARNLLKRWMLKLVVKKVTNR